MSAFHDPDLAAQIAAWHNRHPFAVRVTADQVTGIGTVELPLATTSARAAGGSALRSLDAPDDAPACVESPPAGSLRSRARAQGAQGPQDEIAARVQPQQALDPLEASASRRPRQKLAAAFDEDFIEPLRPAAIARFVARHGAEHDPFEGAAPIRRIPAAGRPPPAAEVVSRFVRTAAIELGDRRVRVLVGASRWRRPQVLGPRLWSRSRITGVAVTTAATFLIAVVALQASWLLPAADQSAGATQPMRASVTSPEVPPSGHASASSLRASDAAPGMAPEWTSPPVPVVAALVAPALPTQAAADALPDLTQGVPASAPESQSAAASARVDPREVARVDIRPRIDPSLAREARKQAALLRAGEVPVVEPGAPAPLAEAAPSLRAPGAALATRVALAPDLAARSTEALHVGAGGPSPLARPSASATSPLLVDPSPPAPDPPAAPATGRLPVGDGPFALVTRQTRSRAASELLLGLMRDSEVPASLPATRTEVIPTAEGFRAGWFPFSTRAEAEAARERLARTGLPTEVIEF